MERRIKEACPRKISFFSDQAAFCREHVMMPGLSGVKLEFDYEVPRKYPPIIKHDSVCL